MLEEDDNEEEEEGAGEDDMTEPEEEDFVQARSLQQLLLLSFSKLSLTSLSFS